MLETLNANAAVEFPNLRDQAERLIGLGLHEQAGITARALRDVGRSSNDAAQHNRLLAFHPDAVPASALAPLLHRDDKPGFVVTDMIDVDSFAPIDAIELPTSPLYLLTGLDRGDDMANWSPDEALPALIARGRTPLLLTEGILWNLQVGAVLERKHCYMTIGSRLRKPNGSLDSRTPALWISNGTGRDGPERRTPRRSGGAGPATAIPGWASLPQPIVRPCCRRSRRGGWGRPRPGQRWRQVATPDSSVEPITGAGANPS